MPNRERRRLKICVYCERSANTRDHVVPRCVLERPLPLNVSLPRVDCCEGCNVSYGRDEEYFIAVMASSGFVPALAAKVKDGGIVDRMLSRRPRLDDRITNGPDVDKNGQAYITVEENRVTRIVQKIAFGLYLHRFQRSRIPQVSQFRVWSIAHAGSSQNPILVMAHNERFQPRRWIKLQKGVFEYMFVRNWVWTDFRKLVCVMKFHETIWAAVFCPEPRGALGSKSCFSVGEKQFRLFAS